jgi:hypothetical protein
MLIILLASILNTVLRHRSFFYFNNTVLYNLTKNGIPFSLYNAMHTQYSTTSNKCKPISIKEF